MKFDTLITSEIVEDLSGRLRVDFRKVRKEAIVWMHEEAKSYIEHGIDIRTVELQVILEKAEFYLDNQS